MVNSIIASVALMGASVAAQSLGNAHVVNKCSYPVYTCVTPAQGGGQQQQDLTLAPGDEWSQTWTQLTNGAGWSIKFSHDQNSFGSNILQYEYTYQNDGTIWYDLSCVDGNPWDKNWEITSSTADCNPKQQAYRYATDDAYGMQSCNADASITVTLCSGEDNTNSTDSSSAPSYQSQSSAVASSAPASSAAAAAPAYAAKQVDNSPASSVPTTFAVSTTPTPTVQGYAVTITKTVYAYATASVIEGEDGVLHAYGKRHQHHPHGHADSQ